MLDILRGQVGGMPRMSNGCIHFGQTYPLRVNLYNRARTGNTQLKSHRHHRNQPWKQHNHDGVTRDRVITAGGVDHAQTPSLLKKHSHAQDPQAHGKAKDLTEHEQNMNTSNPKQQNHAQHIPTCPKQVNKPKAVRTPIASNEPPPTQAPQQGNIQPHVATPVKSRHPLPPRIRSLKRHTAWLTTQQ